MSEQRLNLSEIVMKLNGSVQPVGETYEDGRRLENIKSLTHLVDDLLGEIRRASDYAGRVEYSMKEIGSHAKQFLDDVKQI